MSIATVRRQPRLVQFVIMALLASIAFIAIPANKASAATLAKGPGYMYGKYWLGGYVWGSTTIWCPDPNKPPANPTGSVVTTSVSGSTATNVAKLNYIMQVYGTQTNPGQPKRYNNSFGAAMKLATWTYTGNKALADSLKVKQSATVQSYLKTMIANAEAYAGPYKLVTTLNGKPTLGKSSTASFKVVATRTGKALTNVKLSLTASNAKLSATTISTGSTGTGKVTFTRTTWSDVKISAKSEYAVRASSLSGPATFAMSAA